MSAVRRLSTWTLGAFLFSVLTIGLIAPGDARGEDDRVLPPSDTQPAAPDAHEGAVAGSGERLPLRRQPPVWYQREWAWGVYGAGLAGLALFLVRGKRWATINPNEGQNETQTPGPRPPKNVSIRQTERYARELERTNALLREEVEAKTALLEAAAHDLKNPFFGIKALSEIVLEKEPLSPPVERKIRLIRQSAAEALGLVEDLLHSAAEARKAATDFTVLDAGSLVEWVVKGFEPQAEWKEQHLRCRADGSPPCLVEGDRRRLREAVSNLVSNALKYAPSSTRIDVEVERRGGDVRIAVTDQGPGLSDKDQERMFAPFQRLSPKPTGGESASGLGLYLVKQIVESHHGHVEVESNRGTGSTFTLVLPVVSPEVIPPSEESELPR